MEIIKNSLKAFVRLADKMIDEGQCEHISVAELEMMSIVLNPPKTVGREAAAKHLDISLNMFHELRDMGVIPPARPRKGFKENEYYIRELNDCKEKVNSYKIKRR